MTRFVLRRLAWTVAVVWFVVTATFVLLAAIPADPLDAMLGPHANADTRAAAAEHYCLDRGVAGQYGCFVGDLARGDLGTSYRTNRPVASLLAERAWPTLQLALAAIAIQLAIGIPLGVIAARRRRWDVATTILAALGQAAPGFVVGALLLYVVAYELGAFPLGGYGDGVLDRLWHLALPALTLAAAGAVTYARAVRIEMRDALAADYTRTARAKGLPERAVTRHALRNALGPLITLVGLDLGTLLGGAVVVETIFAWPGLGRETLEAVRGIDTPVIVGVVIVSAIAIAVANLLADLVQAWFDPRIRE